MSYEPNTINIRVYTPGGLQTYVCLPITESMMASDIDNWVAQRGFLASIPGTEPGEDVEVMTHVIKCTQHNNDGSTTPCIGLYYENPKLEFARKAYLDTPEQQAAFEAVSGLKIAALPEFPTANLPKRSDKSAVRFIVTAPTPFKVVMQPHRYTDDDGNEKTTQRFGRFHDAPMPQQSSNGTISKPAWIKNEVAIQAVKQGLAEFGLSYSETAIETARAVIDPNMGAYATAEAYLEALEAQIKIAS